MSIKNVIISYILTFAVFLLVDMLWLGVIARNIYRKYLGSFLTGEVNWTAAFIFYLLFIIGISIFVIYPAVTKNSFLHALVFGALFGVVTYATYDLTNLATLGGWPIKIVVIDILWGAVISGVVSLAGFYITSWFSQ